MCGYKLVGAVPVGKDASLVAREGGQRIAEESQLLRLPLEVLDTLRQRLECDLCSGLEKTERSFLPREEIGLLVGVRVAGVEVVAELLAELLPCTSARLEQSALHRVAALQHGHLTEMGWGKVRRGGMG